MATTKTIDSGRELLNALYSDFDGQRKPRISRRDREEEAQRIEDEATRAQRIVMMARWYAEVGR